jgi:hypothetical protein
MLVLTKNRFVSAVFKNYAFQVRDRDLRSLTPLVKQNKFKITATLFTDYLHRNVITNW